MMRAEKGTETTEGAGPGEQRTTENRWCEVYSYLIAVDTCQAGALQRVGRCLVRWRQLPFPFPEPS